MDGVTENYGFGVTVVVLHKICYFTLCPSVVVETQITFNWVNEGNSASEKFYNFICS